MGIFGNKVPKTTYDIFIKCSNCKETGTRAIPKGMAIAEHMKDAHCKQCGCKTIKQIDQDGMQVKHNKELNNL